MAEPRGPVFTGVKIYNDPQHLFSFWYPHDWSLRPLDDDLHGVVVSPYPENISTSFSVAVRDLQTGVTARDLPILKAGVEEGLEQLGDYRLEQMNEFTERQRFGFELIYTFPFGEARRKRRSLIYYRDHWQYSLMCQGATEEEYDYWLSMFEFMMLTCKSGPFDVATWLSEKYPNNHQGS